MSVINFSLRPEPSEIEKISLSVDATTESDRMVSALIPLCLLSPIQQEAHEESGNASVRLVVPYGNVDKFGNRLCVETNLIVFDLSGGSAVLQLHLTDIVSRTPVGLLFAEQLAAFGYDFDFTNMIVAPKKDEGPKDDQPKVLRVSCKAKRAADNNDEAPSIRPVSKAFELGVSELTVIS